MLTICVQDIETQCVPIEFEDLKTEILIDGKYENGPIVKNLIVKNCACSEIQICDG